jgi:hypothetical protein
MPTQRHENALLEFIRRDVHLEYDVFAERLRHPGSRGKRKYDNPVENTLPV